jgi:hypothetical protein
MAPAIRATIVKYQGVRTWPGDYARRRAGLTILLDPSSQLPGSFRRAAGGQAGAPAAAQRRGRTSLRPASGGRSSRAREGSVAAGLPGVAQINPASHKVHASHRSLAAASGRRGWRGPKLVRRFVSAGSRPLFPASGHLLGLISKGPPPFDLGRIVHPLGRPGQVGPLLEQGGVFRRTGLQGTAVRAMCSCSRAARSAACPDAVGRGPGARRTRAAGSHGSAGQPCRSRPRSGHQRDHPRPYCARFPGSARWRTARSR